MVPRGWQAYENKPHIQDSSTISSISSRRLPKALLPVRAGREAETSRLVIIEERITGSGEDVRRAEFGPDVKNDLVAGPLIVVP